MAILTLAGVSLGLSIQAVIFLEGASPGFWGFVAGRRAGLAGWPLARTVIPGLIAGLIAGVPRRLRAGFASRYARVLVMLAALLLGALAAGALTVVVTALPGLPEAGRSAAAPGSAVVIFAVLLFRARVLLARPAPVRALWPAAVLGAAAVTLALSLGAPVLARLVSKNASPLPGSGSASLPAIHPRPATPRPDQAVPGNPDQHFDQCPPLPDAGEMQAL